MKTKIYVKITGASKPTYWYADKIGDLFEVRDCYNGKFRVKWSGSYNNVNVIPEDCEIFRLSSGQAVESEDVINAFERGYKRGFEDARTELGRMRQ